MGNYDKNMPSIFLGYICILPSYVATTKQVGEGQLHDRGEV